MFCPKCKSLMFPKDGRFKCNKCGYTQGKEKIKENKVVTEQKEKEVVVLEEKVDILPKVKVTCPNCGNNEAYWVLRQTRSSDEPETRIYTCTKCEHHWRAY